MRSERQSVLVIALVVLAILIFGAFIVINLLGPVSPPLAVSEATEEVTEESIEEATAEATEEGTAEATEEAAEAVEQAEVAETTEEATEPVQVDGEVTEAVAAEEDAEATEEATEAADPAAQQEDGAPTPTSMSRVTQSILIGTQITPALQSTPLSPPGGGGDGDPTPTSLSRVTQSIILGMDSAQATAPAETTEESTEEATEESTEEMTAEATEEATEEPGAAGEQAQGGGAAPPGGGQSGTPQPLPTPVPGRPQDSPSALRPGGPVAARQADLFWLMTGLGLVIYVLVLALVFWVMRRRQTDQPPLSARQGQLLVIGGGVLMPAVVLTLLFALTLNTFSVFALSNQQTTLTVEVTGYQWWWEVRYPEHDVVTANEIHIPVGQPVRFELRSNDVIHSFWVPELGGKMDLFPGRTNAFWLQADQAEEYRGLCAEFCGLQHANMQLLVIAQPQDDFEAWLQMQQQPAQEPEGEVALRGQEIFLNSECFACHTIRGTGAEGIQGPDLTHFGSRRTIGAATIPNTPGHLAGWIVDSQGIKPGNLMPPQIMPGDDLQALITYLGGLQ